MILNYDSDQEDESDDRDSESENGENCGEIVVEQTCQQYQKRGNKHFITPRLLSALDSAKVSDGKAMHILMATAEALGHQTSELIINRTTLHRMREEHRKKESERIEANFIDKVMITSSMFYLLLITY